MDDKKARIAEKRRLIDAIREALTTERVESARLAKDAANAATHEEARSEGDKDTRATEASYIARGQAERVHVIDQTLLQLGGLECRAFGSEDRIAITAVIDVEQEPKTARYFLLPSGGGMKLTFEGEPITTLATSSPLGRALIGLTEGEEAEVQSPQGLKIHAILKVR